MPIKGISGQLRYIRIGKVRIGEKRVSDRTHKEYPASIDHFKCEDEPRFSLLLGNEPKELRIAFPWNTIDEIFPQWRCLWSKGGLKCKGDGETAEEYTLEGRTEKTCLGEECPDTIRENGCKPVGNLRFFVPEVSLSGYFQIDTGSINNIININSAIELARRRFNGNITRVPFLLSLHEQEMTVDGKKKTVYLLQLKVDEDRVSAALADEKPKGEIEAPAGKLEQSKKIDPPPAAAAQEYCKCPESEQSKIYNENGTPFCQNCGLDIEEK